MKNQDRPILFLPVESTPRELDYKLNIARLFCHDGFDVMIGNPPFLRDELKYKNFRGLFLEKGMNPDPEYYEKLIEKKVKVFCLSDEGAAIPAFSVTYPKAVSALKLTEKIFMWGQHQLDDLLSRSVDIDLSQKYVVTGYPSFDLSLPKYKDYHAALKPKVLGSGYILINSNFASVNGYTVEENLEGCPDMSPETLEAIKKTYENESNKFSSFKTWLNILAQIFPNERFVIRPHPVEKDGGYKDLVDGFSNVEIQRSGNANQAISGAKLVIHNDCTTALQSYLMNKPVISFAHSNHEPVHAFWALEFGAQPRSIEEAIELVTGILNESVFPQGLRSEIQNKASEIQNSWFANVGKSTALIKSIMVQSVTESDRNFKNHHIMDTRTIIQKIKVLIRRWLPLHYKVPQISRTPLARFTKNDLITRLNLLDQIDGIKTDYTIKNLYPNTFFISIKK